MGSKKSAKKPLELVGLVIWVMLGMCVSQGSAQLSQNFYAATCPNVESIVKNDVTQKFGQTFVTVPATLRLFFHDCFVEEPTPWDFLTAANLQAESIISVLVELWTQV